MAIGSRLKSMLKADEATGFGTYSKDNSGRYYGKDGRPNVTKKGLGLIESMSWFHTMINMPTKYFLLLLFSVYLGINLVFSMVYYMIAADEFIGVKSETSFETFTELFFFSTQTFTTVGYGRISPVGLLSGSLATFEAFIGLLSFALATGLFYGRFSKPEAHIRFSKNVLIAPFQGGKALMFRLAPFKNSYLTEAEIKLTIATREEENGVWKNKFYPLETQISKVNALILSWTVVHPIDDKSPFYNLSDEEIIQQPWELLVFLKGFDEAYSNMVICRSSYMNDECLANVKFSIMHGPNENRTATILDFNHLDSVVKV